MSMLVSFVLSFFPRDVLDEILNLIGSVSEGFPSYSCVQTLISLCCQTESGFSAVNHTARIILGGRPNLSESLLYKQAILHCFAVLWLIYLT